MLVGVLGGFGSGKTLLMTIWGCKLADKPNYVVYSNFKINHPKVMFIDPKEMLDINPVDKKAVLLLDEVYAWLDSRVSASYVNRILSWVVLQSRKRNMDIIYSAQLGSSVDLRMREMTDLIVYCMADYGKNFKVNGFKYLVEWNQIFKIKRFMFYLPFSKAQKYFDKYDTREIVKPFNLEKLKEKLKF